MAGKPDLERIQRLKTTRLNTQDSLICFLRAFQEPTKAIHWAMKNSPPDDIFQTLSSQWVVFIVRAFETYFRDIFLQLCTVDDDFKHKAMKEYGVPKLTSELLLSLETGKISSGEILSDIINFQNLDSIQSAFEPALGKDFIYQIGEETPEYFCLGPEDSAEPNGKSSLGLVRIPPIRFWKDWTKSFYQLFQERHEIIHNANYRFAHDRTILPQWERMSLLLGQLIAIKLSDQYEEPRLLFREWDDSKYEINAEAAEAIGIKPENIGACAGPVVLFVKDILKTDFSTAGAGEKSWHLLEETNENTFRLTTFSKSFRAHN